MVAVMLVVGSLAIIGCIQPRTLELEPEVKIEPQSRSLKLINGRKYRLKMLPLGRVIGSAPFTHIEKKERRILSNSVLLALKFSDTARSFRNLRNCRQEKR